MPDPVGPDDDRDTARFDSVPGASSDVEATRAPAGADGRPPQRRAPRSNTLAVALDNDSRVADLAVKRGLVDDAMTQECLRGMADARRRGESISLAGLMVRRGLITKYQASELNAAAATTGQGELIGGFRIIDKLGEGAMGAVYMAVQLALDRVVALKVLPERLAHNPEYIERFLREAKVAARLEHTNVVRAIDIGESHGKYYFAMELVEGRSLESVLRERGSLAEEEAVDVALQATHGLVCAWRNGLIHRDIKPDNLLVTYEGVVKIADLGLAKGVSSSEDKPLTQEGTTLGTPHYISPEQAMAEDVDIRTDIYALGVTLYRMLTGAFPFGGDTPVKIVTARLAADAKPVREVNPKATREIEQVVRTMMARKRDDRYPDPLVLLYDLELVARGERPEFASGRTSVRNRVVDSAHDKLPARHTFFSAPMRTLRRRPGLAVAMASVALATVGGIVGTAVVLGRGTGAPAAAAPAVEEPAEPSALYDALVRSALAKAVDGEHDEALALLDQALGVKDASGDEGLEDLRRRILRAKLIEEARDAEIAGRPADAMGLYERALEIAADAKLRERVELMRQP
jgi:serine/threonine-protein kinase